MLFTHGGTFSRAWAVKQSLNDLRIDVNLQLLATTDPITSLSFFIFSESTRDESRSPFLSFPLIHK